jgi:cell division transport system permease protein
MEHSGLGFVFVETWTAIRRNLLITLAAIGNMTICLAILGAFALGAVNLDYMASLQAKGAFISVYLAADADGGSIEDELYGDERVKEAEFVSKEQVLLEWGQMTGTDPSELEIIGNPFPDMIRVRVVNPNDLAAVAEKAGQLKGVDDVQYRKSVTDKIVALSQGIKLSGLLLGLILVAGTMLIVNTTIRLTIYARRREIRIMQLVGATNWFIRTPLLFEGAFQGIVGGFLAAVAVIIAYGHLHSYLGQNLQFLKVVYSAQFLVAFGLGLILAGTLFGVAGALISANRYLAES